MLDLDEQFQQLGNAAFAETKPVIPLLNARRDDDRHKSWVAIAAATLLLVGVGGLYAMSFTRSSNDPGDLTVIRIDDPLAINLDEAIQISPQQRIADIGPLLTFDFGQLPPGWTIQRDFTGTLGIPGWTYWQQFSVTSPDNARLSLNIHGRLPASQAPPYLNGEQGTVIEVRGQQARLTPSSLHWIEQDRVSVSIGNAGSGLFVDVAESAITLAQLLQPIDRELDWYAEPNIGAIPVIADRVLLAGVLDGTSWTLSGDASRTQFGTGPNNLTNAGPRPVSEDPDEIILIFEPVRVPGGLVINGNVSSEVSQVRLITPNATVLLPVATISADRVVFAVPIDDRLDPTAIELLDESGDVMKTIPLDDMPPYTIGLADVTDLFSTE